MYARSSSVPRCSVQRTVHEILDTWFEARRWIPASSEVILALGAALKRGGYRSAMQYMSALKEMH
eukprot:3973518-Amphidinium_carterae.1